MERLLFQERAVIVSACPPVLCLITELGLFILMSLSVPRVWFCLAFEESGTVVKPERTPRDDLINPGYGR